MFGLTPRADKAGKPAPLPGKAEGAKISASLDAPPSSEELRLAQALEAVLIRGARSQSPRAPAPKATHDIGLMDRNSPSFFWVASDANATDTATTSSIAKRWLQRAQRERFWRRTRRGVQRVLLACAACAVVALILWTP